MKAEVVDKEGVSYLRFKLEGDALDPDWASADYAMSRLDRRERVPSYFVALWKEGTLNGEELLYSPYTEHYLSLAATRGLARMLILEDPAQEHPALPLWDGFALEKLILESEGLLATDEPA